MIRTNRPHADAGPLVRTVSGRHWAMRRQEQKERERKRAVEARNDTCRQKKKGNDGAAAGSAGYESDCTAATFDFDSLTTVDSITLALP